METKRVISEFLADRPEVVGAFGYGSGVFKQSNYNGEVKPQIDLILVVDNMQDWHKKNIAQNPGDYSLIGKVRLSTVSRKNMKGKNHITYCALIKSNDRLFKFGLIEKDDFISDLTSWQKFYVAGRFHKPVLEVKKNPYLDSAVYKNRRAAFLIACILSEKKTNLHDLFCKICSLSYIGDFRMGIAENPNKVRNIVEGSFDLLQEIYGGFSRYVTYIGNQEVEINYDKVFSDLHFLPQALTSYLGHSINEFRDIEEFRKAILTYLHDCNCKESISQALNGFWNNGILKSAPYVVSKLSKKFVRN